MPRLNRIKIKGFRAFGEPQCLDLPGPMAVVWGPNSQGKTSLAEAIEFLLTGKTIRRELATSAIREFSDCLRNGHLTEDETVEVSAEVVDADSQAHTIRRLLTTDYGANRSCQSKLFIDDVETDDLSAVGIILSHPPLEAPILMQHTIRYSLMASPQERTDYFKALLEISDLETVRSKIVLSRGTVAARTPALLSKLETLATRAELYDHLQSLATQAPHMQQLERALRAAIGGTFPPHTTLPDDVEACATLLKQRLEEKRQATFPLDGLQIRQPTTLQEPAASTWSDFDGFFAARARVDKETARLMQLFKAVLTTPGIGDIAEPTDCPVCETALALTPVRVAAIRAQLEASNEYQTAVTAANTSLRTIQALSDEVRRITRTMRPPYFSWDPVERQRRGFSKAAMEALLGDYQPSLENGQGDLGQAAEGDQVEAGREGTDAQSVGRKDIETSLLLDRWEAESSTLKEAIAAVEGAADELRHTSTGLTLQCLSVELVAVLRDSVQKLIRLSKGAADAADHYRSAEIALEEALRVAVDRKGQLFDWRDLVDLAEKRKELFTALVQTHARAAVTARLDEAIAEIDEAKGAVLDEKFGGLGNDIERWWDLLRPGEPVGFAGVDRAGTGRRFIDIKAKLAPRADSTGPVKLRNAVAVFSDSQLNCLGLGAFLARASRERTGFVVLDDPVPASDEEHKGMFVARVLEALLDEGIQVLLLSHDQTLWRDVQSRYQHLPLDIFQVTIHEPIQGAVVDKTSDTMLSILSTAEPYIRNQDPVVRKIGAERLRDAAERFCKELIVKQRLLAGDDAATLSDYDGKSLRDLRPLADPYLKDPAHPGKLQAITHWLNRGKHDDLVPSVGELAVCFGDLRHFRQTYLA